MININDIIHNLLSGSPIDVTLDRMSITEADDLCEICYIHRKSKKSSACLKCLKELSAEVHGEPLCPVCAKNPKPGNANACKECLQALEDEQAKTIKKKQSKYIPEE
jgi:hypothetical protein